MKTISKLGTSIALIKQKILQSTMELIQIIYSILLFGGGFLLVIMIVSFMLSKSKAHELPYTRVPEKVAISNQIIRSRVNYQNQIASVLPSYRIHKEQNEIRNQSQQLRLQIFPIDQIQPREVKIVRKPTVREDAKIRTTEERKMNGRRYTIVNEDQKNSSNRAINFYL